MRDDVRFGAGREDSTDKFETSIMDSAHYFSMGPAFSDAERVTRQTWKVEIHYPLTVFVIRGGEWTGQSKKFQPLSGGEKLYVHYCILYQNKRYRLWKVDVMFEQKNGIHFKSPSGYDVDINDVKLVDSQTFQPIEMKVENMTRENAFKAIQNDILETMGKTTDYPIADLDAPFVRQAFALPRPQTLAPSLGINALAPPAHPPHASPMVAPPYHRALSSSAYPQLASPAYPSHASPMVAPPAYPSHASPSNPEVAKAAKASALGVLKAAETHRESLTKRPRI